ncbi:MAG: hypothetical protein JOY90_28310 [Bradyrhizobium sp.]|uniref:hypothetical protein n=1 Tax=Bradyrhizobium sp. TaxID=376 RepID=UPI001DD2F31B|nr:hypothetical protein [Bradyrhizobium sp.]MBV9564313.1 hypothetical protein [Bradyrhizobium sp.]
MGFNPLKAVEHAVGSVAHAIGDAAEEGGKAFESALKDAEQAAKHMSLSDLGHTALDVASFVPGLGTVTGLVNAGWYAAEGDWKDAALSAATAIPIAGDFVDAAKVGKDAITIGKDVETAVKLGEDATKVAEDGTKVAKDATDVAQAGSDASKAEKVETVPTQPATSPSITPEELSGKTRTEIRDMANDKGLVPKGDTAHADYPRKWSDPVTGEPRLRLDRGHVDPTTGLPYNNPNAAVDHVHGYEVGGNPIKVNGDKHIPTAGE